MSQILVVDDKPNMLTLWRKILEPGHEVITAEDGTAALEKLSAAEFDVVVTDLRMPGADGFAVLRGTLSRWPQTQVLLVTAYATVDQAVQAMREGAFDFLTKPFEPDHAKLRVERALERRGLKRETTELRDALLGPSGYGDMVGTAPATKKVFGLLGKAAASEVTVLIQGESGTGKELAARAVHLNSVRREERFVAINCGALPSDLIESELFGHAKGSFSGAHSDKAGLFEAADKGTLFLDEVSELPPPVQVKLNRVLQEREVRRVGDNVERKVDVRVIAASNVDLRERIRTGQFREDLFYRLHVFTVWLPPLRERREDIPLLVETLLKRHRAEGARVDAGALKVLTAYGWPGNVRELENVLQRALTLSESKSITAAELPEELSSTGLGAMEPLVHLPFREAMRHAQDDAARRYLLALLEKHGGSVTRAAEAAGMARETLHRQLKRYGLDAGHFR